VERAEGEHFAAAIEFVGEGAIAQAEDECGGLEAEESGGEFAVLGLAEGDAVALAVGVRRVEVHEDAGEVPLADDLLPRPRFDEGGAEAVAMLAQ
jgi:hypothetical protein